MIAPRTLILLAALVLTLGLAACGSGGSPSTTSTGAGTETFGGRPAQSVEEGANAPGGGSSRARQPRHAGAQPEHPAFKPRPHHDSGGGAAQFEAEGGDNSIEEFGGEGSGSDFDEAAAALHGYLDARAARAWSGACGYLAAGVGRMLVEQLGGGKGSCAEVLAGISAGVPESALREAAVADVGSFRAEGDSGYLLFHGAGGSAYFIPMAREGGRWKVAALAASGLG